MLWGHIFCQGVSRRAWLAVSGYLQRSKGGSAQTAGFWAFTFVRLSNQVCAF